jgi:hypothetical protein
LIVGNKPFGISSNFRHLCAAVAPGRIEFFTHDWKRGAWNLAFLAGIFVGAVAAWQLAPPLTVAISPGTVAALHRLGLNDLTGLAPREVFAWSSIFTVKGYAGGCTSGHAIAGLADFQLASLLAVCGFFAGGLIATYFVLPMILG